MADLTPDPLTVVPDVYPATEQQMRDEIKRLKEVLELLTDRDDWRSVAYARGAELVRLTDECDTLREALSKSEAAAAWCDAHKPDGGVRAVCLVCACQKLSAALSRISYACGEPNEMGASLYDAFPDEDAVVEQVRDALRHQDLKNSS